MPAIFYSPGEYLEVIQNAGLWPHLLEALHSLGDEEAGRLYSGLLPRLQNLPALPRLVLWTGLAAMGLTRPNAAIILEGNPLSMQPLKIVYFTLFFLDNLV